VLPVKNDCLGNLPKLLNDLKILLRILMLTYTEMIDVMMLQPRINYGTPIGASIIVYLIWKVYGLDENRGLKKYRY